MVMTTGEFDFDGIFFNSQEDAEEGRDLFYPEIAYTLWIVFIILMPIILTNLLVCMLMCATLMCYSYSYACVWLTQRITKNWSANLYLHKLHANCVDEIVSFLAICSIVNITCHRLENFAIKVFFFDGVTTIYYTLYYTYFNHWINRERNFFDLVIHNPSDPRVNNVFAFLPISSWAIVYINT